MLLIGPVRFGRDDIEGRPACAMNVTGNAISRAETADVVA
jgi:hypothetical protein